MLKRCIEMQYRNKHKWQDMALMVVIGLVVPGCIVLNGCSSASRLFLSYRGESHRAVAKVTIVWPERKLTRLIPVASNGLKGTIQGINGFTVTQVISRPVTSAVFTNLPPGALTITAAAHADTSGAVEPPQLKWSMRSQTSSFSLV